MQLPAQAISQLKGILEKDYGKKVSDEEAQFFGTSLLRLTRLASTAIARAEEKTLSDVQQSDGNEAARRVLGIKTPAAKTRCPANA